MWEKQINEMKTDFTENKLTLHVSNIVLMLSGLLANPLGITHYI